MHIYIYIYVCTDIDIDFEIIIDIHVTCPRQYWARYNTNLWHPGIGSYSVSLSAFINNYTYAYIYIYMCIDIDIDFEIIIDIYVTCPRQYWARYNTNLWHPGIGSYSVSLSAFINNYTYAYIYMCVYISISILRSL